MSVSSTSPPQLPTDDEPQINPTLKRKVQKVLESSTDDDELILALKNLYVVCHKYKHIQFTCVV
jgi:hypothetical protein